MFWAAVVERFTVDSGRSRCIGHGVGAAAAGQRVVGGKALDGVIARAGVDHVIPGAPGQRVVVGRAGQVLEIRDDVRARSARVLRGRDRQADGLYLRSRIRIGQRIRPAAAVQCVIAGQPFDEVGVAVARQGVVEGRPRQVLEVGQGVGSRADRVLAARDREADGYAASRIRIRQRIGPGSAVQGVISGQSLDDVGVAVARQRVIVCRSGQVFEIGDRVRACAARVLRRRDGKADGYAPCGIGICRDVRPCSAVQGVVAGKALDHIAVAITRQRVIVRGTGQVREARDGVRSCPDRILGRRRRQIYCHARRSRRIRQGVGTATACQRVVAATAIDRVVVGIARDRVIVR